MESDFFDVDVKQGTIHITLTAYETVYIPFSMLNLRYVVVKNCFSS